MASRNSTSDGKSLYLLLNSLCSKITGLKGDAVSPFCRVAIASLGSSTVSPVDRSELEITETIKRKLARQQREKDAAIFAELYRKLQSKDLLRNRCAVLTLLYLLHGEGTRQSKSGQHAAFIHGLHEHAMSTPHWSRTPLLHRPPPEGGTTTLHHVTGSSGATSGISSIHSSLRSDDPSPVPQSLPPSYLRTPAITPYVGGGGYQMAPPPLRRHLPEAEKTGSGVSADVRPGRGVTPQRHSFTVSSRKHGENSSFELPEAVILREIIAIFQGIEGKYIKYEVAKEGFRIDPKIGVPKSVRRTVSKLAECGWLYNKTRKYADSRSTDRAFGLVGQSFCAALHEQLAEYYRVMGLLEAQLAQEDDPGVTLDSELTLRQLAIWICDPIVRLKALASLVDVCQGKKGGALASVIHSYMQHGDPSMQTLVRHSLTVVAQPIFQTVIRWIYDGHLEDTYHEFFVASDPVVKDDRLWHDKYSLRKSMIPSFLTLDQAKRILLTGKSINFLRQVCQDRTIIRQRDIVKAAETNQVESIFTQVQDSAFSRMLHTVYKETSRHLLEVLHTKYKFLEHLKAMRRYLLLGQGDFIRHLMDLLQEDLAKPAQKLFLHNLTGILESAIRATNAQYDDADILKRLDVRLLEVSPEDTGWDVFSLDYHMDGPIRTVFTPESMVTYLRVFNFLWRAKRMEYILAGIWKAQVSNAQLLRSMPEISAVLHQSHVIGSEMVHFVQQVQYYINFEVLECSWHELLNEVKEAEDLDQIIAAHQVFQDHVLTRSLLDNQSTAILTQLRTIFDLVIQFQTIQDALYEKTSAEVDARAAFERRKRQKTDQGEWAVTEQEQADEDRRRANFRRATVPATRSQLLVLAQSYQNMVQQFLVMLTSHADVSLRFLSFRLDFNEHYCAKEPKLRSPRAYHKTRKQTRNL